MPVFEQSELTVFAANVLNASGFTADEAKQTAEMLVWANLRGVDSHGVLRIPRYVEMIKAGVICAGQVPQAVQSFGASRVIDFGKAPGTVAMNYAVKTAGDLAMQFGIGWCAARNISHAGAIGYFTMQLANRGLVGIAMTASKPLMSYFGAKGEALSTNPLSIAVPRSDGSDPILLDMSTAAVALGKVMAAKDAGMPIPKGWAMDANGVETQDPNNAVTILPMAGVKGTGLSLMIEILASVLVGNPVIGPVLTGNKKGGFNGLVLAVNPQAFGDTGVFLASVEELVGAIHALEPTSIADRVKLPGERGYEVARERSEKGIPIAEGTAKRLMETATRLGVTFSHSLR